MKYATGNIWDMWFPGDYIVIPTNLQTKRNGKAVMGAGLALQAASRFPQLPEIYGRHLDDENYSSIFIWEHLVCMPTKGHWKDASNINLIEGGLKELMLWFGKDKNRRVYVPQLGCGLGGLSWEREVRPLMDVILNDRFTVVTYE